MKNLLLLACILLIWGCNDPESPSNPIANGTYSGTFTRSSPNSNSVSSQVILTFENGSFAGSSNIQKYPAICNGTYTVESDKINFVNNCIWTAEFDWSLILNGEYQYTLNGSELRILKEYSVYSDIYNLTKNP